MAWNVNQIYEFSKVLINKYQSGTYEPDEFFYTWNSEQRSFMGDLLGRFQPRSNSKAGANTGLIENQTVMTSLSPFTKTANITVTAGVATKPEDYIYSLAMRVGTNQVHFVNKGQLYAIQNSVIDPPSTSENIYYATEYNTYFRVFPSTVGQVAFDYIMDCPDVIWGFSLNDGLPVYDPSASVDPIWQNPELQEITKRTLRILGVHFGSADFQNFGSQTIITGD